MATTALITAGVLLLAVVWLSMRLSRLGAGLHQIETTSLESSLKVSAQIQDLRAEVDALILARDQDRAAVDAQITKVATEGAARGDAAAQDQRELLKRMFDNHAADVRLDAVAAASAAVASLAAGADANDAEAD